MTHPSTSEIGDEAPKLLNSPLSWSTPTSYLTYIVVDWAWTPGGHGRILWDTLQYTFSTYF